MGKSGRKGERIRAAARKSLRRARGAGTSAPVAARRRPIPSELDGLSPAEMWKLVRECLPPTTEHPVWNAVVALGALADLRMVCKWIESSGEERMMVRRPREAWLIGRRVEWLRLELRERSRCAVGVYRKFTDATMLHAAVCDYAEEWPASGDPIADWLRDWKRYRVVADRLEAILAIENPDLGELQARVHRQMRERSGMIAGAQSPFDMARRAKELMKQMDAMGEKAEVELKARERVKQEKAAAAFEPKGAVQSKLFRVMDSKPRQTRQLCELAKVKLNSHARTALAALLAAKACKYDDGYHRPGVSGEKR